MEQSVERAEGHPGPPRRRPGDPAEPQVVFVCRGPYCRERGARGVMERLRDLLRLTGRPLPVLSYNCFGRCDDGPNVVLFPDGVWYSGVEPAELEAVVADLAGGAPALHRRVEVPPEERTRHLANIREILPHVLPGPAGRRRWWPFGRSEREAAGSAPKRPAR